MHGFDKQEALCKYLPGSHMSSLYLLREAHVDFLDFFREDQGAAAETDGEETVLEFAHALGEGGHFGGELGAGRQWVVQFLG